MKTNLIIPTSKRQRLSGILHSPDAQPTLTYAMFAHCFSWTKDIHAANTITQTLAEALGGTNS